MLRCYSYDIVCQEIPDEISLAVNISGCPNRCPGCHSPWLWEDKGEFLTDELLHKLKEQYSAAITCFCIMGGDGDVQEVERVSRLIRAEFPQIRTAWYSGLESIPEGFDTSILDYLTIGPYKEALGGLKSPDTNQRLYRIAEDGSMTHVIMHK